MYNEFSSGKGSGQISEWNEGELKSLRLHKAQEIINFASITPFKKLDFFGYPVYGYKVWFEGINILFREGKAKYSPDEFKEVKQLRDMIDELINADEFCVEYKHITKKGLVVTNEKWNQLKKLLNDYEDKVYFYNDQHGLSTRNKEYDEGL